MSASVIGRIVPVCIVPFAYVLVVVPAVVRLAVVPAPAAGAAAPGDPGVWSVVLGV
jgi:hypothetical protein